LKVTPHVMRHSFAVRMLSALMREGRDRAGNPYHLLANPVLTVMQLLGHASVETTQKYLFQSSGIASGGREVAGCLIKSVA
jgi:integrase